MKFLSNIRRYLYKVWSYFVNSKLSKLMFSALYVPGGEGNRFYSLIFRLFLLFRYYIYTLKILGIKSVYILQYLVRLFRGVALLFIVSFLIYLGIVSGIDYFGFDVSVCNRLGLFFVVLFHVFMFIQNDFSFYKELFDFSYLEHFDIALGAGTLVDYPYLNKDLSVDDILEGDFNEISIGTEAYLLEDFDVTLDLELESLLFFNNAQMVPNSTIWFEDCKVSYDFLLNSDKYLKDILKSKSSLSIIAKPSDEVITSNAESFILDSFSDYKLFSLFTRFGLVEFPSLYLNKAFFSNGVNGLALTDSEIRGVVRSDLIKNPWVCDSLVYLLLSEVNTNMFSIRSFDDFIWDDGFIIDDRIKLLKLNESVIDSYIDSVSFIDSSLFRSRPYLKDINLLEFETVFLKESLLDLVPVPIINSNQTDSYILEPYSRNNIYDEELLLKLFIFSFDKHYSFLVFLFSVVEGLDLTDFIRKLDITNQPIANTLKPARTSIYNYYYKHFYNVSCLNFSFYEGYKHNLFLQDSLLGRSNSSLLGFPLLASRFSPVNRFLPFGVNLNSRTDQGLLFDLISNTPIILSFSSWYFFNVRLLGLTILLKLLKPIIKDTSINQSDLEALASDANKGKSDSKVLKAGFFDKWFVVLTKKYSDLLDSKQLIIEEFWFNKLINFFRKLLFSFYIRFMSLWPFFKLQTESYSLPIQFPTNKTISSKISITKPIYPQDKVDYFNKLYLQSRINFSTKLTNVSSAECFDISFNQINTMNRWQKKERFFELSCLELFAPNSILRSSTSVGSSVSFEFDPTLLNIDEYNYDQSINAYSAIFFDNELYFNSYGEPKPIETLDPESRKFLIYTYRPKFWDPQVDFISSIFTGLETQRQVSFKQAFKDFEDPEDFPASFGFFESVSFSWVILITIFHYIYCHIQFDIWQYRSWFNIFQRSRRRKKTTRGLPDKLLFGAPLGFKWSATGRVSRYQMKQGSSWYKNIPYFKKNSQLNLQDQINLSQDRRISRNRLRYSLINLHLFGHEIFNSKTLSSSFNGLNDNMPKTLRDFIRALVLIKNIGSVNRYDHEFFATTDRKSLKFDEFSNRNNSTWVYKFFGLNQTINQTQIISNSTINNWPLMFIRRKLEPNLFSDSTNITSPEYRPFRKQYIKNISRYRNINYVERLGNSGLYKQHLGNLSNPLKGNFGGLDGIRFTDRTGFSLQRVDAPLASRGFPLLQRFNTKQRRLKQLPFFKRYKKTYHSPLSRSFPSSNYGLLYNNLIDSFQSSSLEITKKSSKGLKRVFPISNVRKTRNYSWLLFHYRIGINGGNFFGYDSINKNYQDLKRNSLFESRFHMDQDGSSAWDVSKFIHFFNFINLPLWWNNSIGQIFPFFRTTIANEKSLNNETIYNYVSSSTITDKLKQSYLNWDNSKNTTLNHLKVLMNSSTNANFIQQFHIVRLRLKLFIMYDIVMYIHLGLYKWLLELGFKLSKSNLSFLINGFVFIIIFKQLLYVFNWYPTLPRDNDEMVWEEVKEDNHKSYNSINPSHHLDHLCLVDSTLYDYYTIQDWDSVVDNHEVLSDHLRYDEYSLGGLFIDNVLALDTNIVSTFSSSDLIRYNLNDAEISFLSNFLIKKISNLILLPYRHFVINLSTKTDLNLGLICEEILDKHHYQINDFSYYTTFNNFLKSYLGTNLYNNLSKESLSIFWLNLSRLFISARKNNLNTNLLIYNSLQNTNSVHFSYFNFNNNLLKLNSFNEIPLTVKQDLIDLNHLNQTLLEKPFSINDLINSVSIQDISLDYNFDQPQISNLLFYQLRELRQYILSLVYIMNRTYTALPFIVSKVKFNYSLRPINYVTDWQDFIYRNKQQIIFDYKDSTLYGTESGLYLKQGDLDKDPFSLNLNYLNFENITNFGLQYSINNKFFKFKSNLIKRSNFLTDDTFLKLVATQVINSCYFIEPNYNTNFESNVYNHRLNIISSNQTKLYYNKFLSNYYNEFSFNLKPENPFKQFKASISLLSKRLRAFFISFI